MSEFPAALASELRVIGTAIIQMQPQIAFPVDQNRIRVEKGTRQSLQHLAKEILILLCMEPFREHPTGAADGRGAQDDVAVATSFAPPIPDLPDFAFRDGKNGAGLPRLRSPGLR